MKNYSLKEAFYKSSYLLNEMAIITPRNFLEKTVKLCNDKPALIGIPSITSVEEAFDYIEDNLYKKQKYMTQSDVNKYLEELQAEYEEKESSRQKSVEIRKSKGIKVNEKDLQPITLTDDIKQQKLDLFEATAVKEKNVILEILKIVKVTDLLSLKGKENKKQLKEAEEILTVQLRKHINIDGESIEFKNILPMFDNIIKYVESKVDIDFDLCIKYADLYMRNYYNIARREEKDIIDRGDFDFDIVMKRMMIVNKDSEDTETSKKYSLRNKANYVHVFEDEDMVILYPRTYDKFRHILNNVYKVEPGFSWCTYASAGTWASYNSKQYVAIAHSKNVDLGEPAWAISLKIEKSGEIDVEGTCDYDNNHVDIKFINKYFSDKARESIRELPGFVDLAVDSKQMRETIKNYADLNDIDAIKENIIRSFAYFGERETQNFFSMLYQETPLSKETITEIIVETICYFMFDSPAGEFEYLQDFFNAKNKYPTQNIYNFLKEKILNPRSHARYFNGFLILQKLAGNKITELSFEEILEATKIACSSTNTNNLKRIINLLLNNDKYVKYLNPSVMINKEESLTDQNIAFYDMLINTRCVKEYIKVNGVYALKGAAKTIVSAEVFLARLLFRYSDVLIESIYKKNPDIEDPVADIDLTLVASYIGKEAQSPDFFNFSKKTTYDFLKIDLDTYNDLKRDMFNNYETWKLLKDRFDNQEIKNLFDTLSIELKNKNKNIPVSDTLFKIFNDIISFPVYTINDIFKSLYDFLIIFNKDLLDFDQKTLSNIKKILTTAGDTQFELIAGHVATAIMRVDLKSEYVYKLFSLLDNIKKNEIIIKGSPKITRAITQHSTSNEEKLKKILNLNKHGKKFFEGLDINYIVKKSNSNLFRLIPCFLDFVPMNKKSIFLAECVEQLINRDGLELYSLNEAGIIQTIVNVLKQPNVLAVFRNNQQVISQKYGQQQSFIDNESHVTSLINSILKVFNENSIAFPKEVLQAIMFNNKRNTAASSKDVEIFLTNFITISEDGGNRLYGKELSIVRDTLKNLYNFKGGKDKVKNNAIQRAGSLFKTPDAKEFAFRLVSKMNKHARMHMTLAFPDERAQLRANTPEEDAELQADSLIRMYVKMLLS